jgi:hypothetical protein
MPSSRSGSKHSPIEVAVPNYEVKVFLTPSKVLNLEQKPTREVMEALDLKDDKTKITMQFLDTRPRRIHPQGWNVRVRKIEGKKEFEITYKRRYPIAKGKLSAALALAAKESFDADENDYAAQVEWAFARQTLTFSCRKSFRQRGYQGMELPTVEEVRAAAIEGMPGKLDRWKKEGWARELLERGQLYGPVFGRRWIAKWPGPDLDFEVWLLKAEKGAGLEAVVELSFKADQEDEADEAREKLLSFLRDRDWLQEQEVLKTEMIFLRY